MTQNQFQPFAAKMRDSGASDAAVRAFQHAYDSLTAGMTGMVPESEIQPVTKLPRLQDIAQKGGDSLGLLSQSVIIKLNGGLGTSMGLERAKSLLEVKDGLTFLDFILKQILHLRKEYQAPLRFLFMNSFSTSKDTLAFLTKYPELGEPSSMELMQNQVPKVDAKSFQPVSWPEHPQLEWCPPGHGDLYPSLLGSGLLDRLLSENVKFLFVSNSDNLGATLDLNLLSYFSDSGQPFMMEVAERTASDRKGGHLAQRNGRLLLRESAQCPEADQTAFQDITKHGFFNTNNLWVRLDYLKQALDANRGFIPLPMIKNAKTVDPRSKTSPQVFQLETAMGAAIECFEGAGAVVVPRSRFAPVKTTADLLALRSDAYRVTDDWRIVLAGEQPPTIDLDATHYKMVDQLDEKLKDGVPSLKACQELTVRGPIQFNSGNIFRGKVSLTNKSAEPHALAPGDYADCTREV